MRRQDAKGPDRGNVPYSTQAPLALHERSFTNRSLPAILPIVTVDFFCSFWWAVCLRNNRTTTSGPSQQVSEGLFIMMTLTAIGG